jgi:hypothetical protein
MPLALCPLLLVALDFALRNPKSAFGWANFFMEDTKSQFLKRDPAASLRKRIELLSVVSAAG